MADYLAFRTASGPAFDVNLIGRFSPSSFDFVGRERAASPKACMFVELPVKVARPARGRYSFREVFSSLNTVELTAAQEERSAFDENLRSRLEIGEVSRLYYYRCLKRMTQEQLAAWSGSRQSFLSQVEKRKRALTWKQAEKFAAALGIEPEELMEKRAEKR
jgi:antitoxin component HigA of HigAB toxin-antitoxin module